VEALEAQGAQATEPLDTLVNGAPLTSEGASSHFLTVLEQFKGHVTGIVTLATGALVLSATFIKDAPVSTRSFFWLLKSSWGLFTLSIIAGVLYSYALTLLYNSRACWERDACPHRTFLAISNFFLHVCFLLAIIIFLVFVVKSM